MNVMDLVPAVEGRVQFNLRCRKFVPKQVGCYALATFQGYLLYVGMTDNLCRRFAEHRDCSPKRKATPKGCAFWFYYLTCEEQQKCRIERTWINSYLEVHGELPHFNCVNSPVH